MVEEHAIGGKRPWLGTGRGGGGWLCEYSWFEGSSGTVSSLGSFECDNARKERVECSVCVRARVCKTATATGEQNKLPFYIVHDFRFI